MVCLIGCAAHSQFHAVKSDTKIIPMSDLVTTLHKMRKATSFFGGLGDVRMAKTIVKRSSLQTHLEDFHI